MTYWVVLKSNRIWTDYIESENECIEHIKFCMEKGYGTLSDFDYREMTIKEVERGTSSYMKYNNEIATVIMTVMTKIKLLDINELSIYLHSFQAQDYTVEEIRNILSSTVEEGE